MQRRIWATLPVLLAVMTSSACEDPLNRGTWSAAPDTVEAWSASRVELLGRGSAITFAEEPPFARAVEAPGSSGLWDAVLIDLEGGLALAPASWFPGQASRAGIAIIEGTSFAELRRAPRDTARYLREPVLLRMDGVYVVRTRVAGCDEGGSGVRYAKVRPLEIDVSAGRVELETINNPWCGDRSFEPPN